MLQATPGSITIRSSTPLPHILPFHRLRATRKRHLLYCVSMHWLDSVVSRNRIELWVQIPSRQTDTVQPGQDFPEACPASEKRTIMLLCPTCCIVIFELRRPPFSIVMPLPPSPAFYFSKAHTIYFIHLLSSPKECHLY